MNILLFSSDTFLIKILDKEFGESDLKIKKNIRDYNIIIFDDCDKDFIKEHTVGLLGADLDNRLVVNIGPKQIDNIVNIVIPFRINFLIDKISRFNDYYKKYIVKYGDGILNTNKKTFSFRDNTIYFTNREIELIDFLLKNKNASKQTLLDKIWNIKTSNDKIVETAIYNIRQKFKDIDFTNFILCEDGRYSIAESTQH